ncbi:uncharacterized protein LOC119100141 [Pollicipes pollicipes]|uniref:uncharacterized protein LOC119100141 n=1 Tax=Pollicipes pollicipes TaxID=41117 RepID=UPI0018856AF7|nr:uncharacterized protein LOC119100141 [Pollicipes pollicipes]
MSVKVDGVDKQRLSWSPDFNNPETEAYQQLAWDARRAINSAMTQTTMKDIYMGNEINSFYSLGGRLILNTTVSLLDTAQTRRREVKNELQRQMIRVIKAKDNNIGDSTLFVEGPLNPIPGIQDLNECSGPGLHDCDENAVCSNVFGSFLCRCQPGYDDRYRSDVARAGRHCESCSEDFCGGHGTCQINDGQKSCLCRGSYYGARCDIDGEVLGAALGATAAAALVIIATFIGLCKWSKRWHKGQSDGKAEVGSLAVPGGFGYGKPGGGLGPAGFPPVREDRLRWARLADTMAQQNIYAPEPMFGGPPHSQLPPYGAQAGLGAGTLRDGPASLGMAGGRPVFVAPVRRSVTPVTLPERPALRLGERNDSRRLAWEGMTQNQSLVYYDIHDFEQRDMGRGTTRGQPPAPLSTYSSRTSNYFR